VDLIYMDFSISFDLFLDKMLTAVGFLLLGSYFSGRIQRVRMGDCVPRDMLVTSGLPQGNHLEPLCFIWFVNEIFRHVRVFFYADDMKLFLPVRGFRDCLKIQSDLNRLLE
jgi:hypothetical protein